MTDTMFAKWMHLYGRNFHKLEISPIALVRATINRAKNLILEMYA